MKALALCALFGVAAAGAPPPDRPFPVRIEVDAGRSLGHLAPLWRFFGADEPNYATMPDGRLLLAELGGLRPGQVYFRAHNLLTTGDGTPAFKWGSTNAYTEDPAGRPVYDWTILDRIFDTYRAAGVRPYVEIGFMPKALSLHPEPYQHHWPHGELATGWSYPPTDYRRWAELVYRWTRHCVQRYGADEVARWYWEVWNEPNLPAYWHGSAEDFFRLHDYAVDAVRRALPAARVGGPDSAGAGGSFLRGFLEHCARGVNAATGARGTPVDFLSFHAKGRPEYRDGHVRMGLAVQLRAVDEGLALIASFPEFKDKPVVIGESDPDGCGACVGPQLAYRPGTLYASYTADCLARELELAHRRGVRLQGALTWAFEFEGQPYFSGRRVLATNGIDLPVLNVFRLFARLGAEQVPAVSSGEIPLSEVMARGVRSRPDVGTLAAIGPGCLTVLVWHYHDDAVPGPAADVRLSVAGLAAAGSTAELEHFRIDERHSNAFAAWKRMGSPPAPTPAQSAALRAAGGLQTLADGPRRLPVSDGQAALRFALPRQAVSLLVFRWPADRR